MIANPDVMAERYVKAGADLLTFHVEASENPRLLLEKIRQWGARPGLSLNPQTPVEKILPFLDEADLVLVMSVNPGFGDKLLFLPSWIECLVSMSVGKV